MPRDKRVKKEAEQKERQEESQKQVLMNQDYEEELKAGAQLIWSTSEQDRRFYWHPDQFLVSARHFIELAFSSDPQFNEWKQKTGWKEAENQWIPKTESELVSRTVYAGELVFEQLRDKDNEFFIGHGISFPEGAKFGPYWARKSLEMINTRPNIAAFMLYLKENKADLEEAARKAKEPRVEPRIDKPDGTLIVQVRVDSYVKHDSCCRFTSQEDMVRLFKSPEDFGSQSCKGPLHMQSHTFEINDGKKTCLERGDQRNACAKIDLYFDHHGRVYVAYDRGRTILRDPTNESKEIVWISSYDRWGGGDWKFEVYSRNMVPVEMAIPYFLELMKNAEIDISSDEIWEVNPFPESKCVEVEYSDEE